MRTPESDRSVTEKNAHMSAIQNHLYKRQKLIRSTRKLQGYQKGIKEV